MDQYKEMKRKQRKNKNIFVTMRKNWIQTNTQTTQNNSTHSHTQKHKQKKRMELKRNDSRQRIHMT